MTEPTPPDLTQEQLKAIATGAHDKRIPTARSGDLLGDILSLLRLSHRLGVDIRVLCLGSVDYAQVKEERAHREAHMAWQDEPVVIMGTRICSYPAK